MDRPRRNRVLRSRRLFLWLSVLALLTGAALGVAGSRGGSAAWTGYLWKLLGVRVAPSQVDGLPSEADGGLLPGDTGATGGTGGSGGPGTSPGPGASLPPGADTGPAAPGPDQVSAATTFAWTVDYDLCGDEVVEEAPAEPGLVGLTRESLAVELRDWEIKAFSPARVEVARHEQAMCPKHTKRTLRLEDGELVVYAGAANQPGVELIRLGPTGITEDRLSAAEAGLLRTGWILDSQEDVVRYLEGLGD